MNIHTRKGNMGGDVNNHPVDGRMDVLTHFES